MEATYKQLNTDFIWEDNAIYGASRLGQKSWQLNLTSLPGSTTLLHYSYTSGNKHFEMSNHLGNVLAVITDRKIAKDINADLRLDYFEVDYLSFTDYYPFGMQMKERSWSGGYRFGFNGKEFDSEIYGMGNCYDYGFRIYNSRLGKFLSVDPLFKDYPELTTYQFASNTPIQAIDLDGLEAQRTITFYSFDVPIELGESTKKNQPIFNNISKDVTKPVDKGAEISTGASKTIKDKVTAKVTLSNDKKVEFSISTNKKPEVTVHKVILDGENNETKKEIQILSYPKNPNPSQFDAFSLYSPKPKYSVEKSNNSEETTNYFFCSQNISTKNYASMKSITHYDRNGNKIVQWYPSFVKTQETFTGIGAIEIGNFETYENNYQINKYVTMGYGKSIPITKLNITATYYMPWIKIPIKK